MWHDRCVERGNWNYATCTWFGNILMPWILCLDWAATTSGQPAFRQVLLWFQVPWHHFVCRQIVFIATYWDLQPARGWWWRLVRGAPFESSINIDLVILLVWLVGIVSVLWLPKFMFSNQYSSFLVGRGVVRYVTILWAGTTFTHCWQMDRNGNCLTQSPIAKISHIEFQN